MTHVNMVQVEFNEINNNTNNFFLKTYSKVLIINSLNNINNAIIYLVVKLIAK
jgi:hypothetical protein